MASVIVSEAEGDGFHQHRAKIIWAAAAGYDVMSTLGETAIFG